MGVANRGGDFELCLGDLGATFSCGEEDVGAANVYFSIFWRTPGLEKLKTGGSLLGACIESRIT